MDPLPPGVSVEPYSVAKGALIAWDALDAGWTACLVAEPGAAPVAAIAARYEALAARCEALAARCEALAARCEALAARYGVAWTVRGSAEVHLPTGRYPKMMCGLIVSTKQTQWGAVVRAVRDEAPRIQEDDLLRGLGFGVLHRLFTWDAAKRRICIA